MLLCFEKDKRPEQSKIYISVSIFLYLYSINVACMLMLIRFIIYTCIYRFLRAVSYRQLVRLVWGFTGSSRRLPLPSCCYNAIRKAFPNPENQEYKGFEEDEDV